MRIYRNRNYYNSYDDIYNYMNYYNHQMPTNRDNGPYPFSINISEAAERNNK